MLADPIITTLDPDQRRAVLHDGGPLLLVAGAGSGKTRAIVARIVRLVRDGVHPRSLLGITFTNCAAGATLPWGACCPAPSSVSTPAPPTFRGLALSTPSGPPCCAATEAASACPRDSSSTTPVTSTTCCARS